MSPATEMQQAPVRLGASQIATAAGFFGQVTDDCRRNRPYTAGWNLPARNVNGERRDDCTPLAGTEKNGLAIRHVSFERTTNSGLRLSLADPVAHTLYARSPSSGQ